jgi:16S rRNA (guanine527-N7)-methyltransferase
VRITELAARYGLPAAAVTALRSLVEAVAGDDGAPTTVREPGAVLRDHVADSLAGLELDVVRGASDIADLGAGAGFPGLPLAIALPASTVTLVESNLRKCAFIDRAARACGAENAAAVHARAEAWAGGIGRCDLVTARALAPLPVIAEYAAPLLALGGSLVAWRGQREPADEAAAALAAAELGLHPAIVTAVEPYPGALHRHLHVMTKVSYTPERFPRRPGMARKRPLGTAPSDRARR